MNGRFIWLACLVLTAANWLANQRCLIGYFLGCFFLNMQLKHWRVSRFYRSRSELLKMFLTRSEYDRLVLPELLCHVCGFLCKWKLLLILFFNTCIFRIFLKFPLFKKKSQYSYFCSFPAVRFLPHSMCFHFRCLSFLTSQIASMFTL